MKPLKSNNKSQEALKNDEEPVSAILPADDNPVNFDEMDPDLAAELYERELEKKLVKQNKSKKFDEENENNNSEPQDTSSRKKRLAKKAKDTHADSVKEEAFHITLQDMLRIERNQRTILHRAALDQNTDLLRTLCMSAETKIENFVVEFIDKPDKFGNTALLTACILNNDFSAKKRPECIEILLKARANPNIRSGLTLWTPLTWCAYYGDLDSVKSLLNASAIAYLPDSKGCYPIDYCGLQAKHQIGRRKDVVAELVKNLTEVLVEFDKAKMNPGLMEARYKINDSYRFLKLPALKSSLLYWAIYFRLDKREYLEPLLRLDDIYPEVPILSLNRRNCYHACASSGNLEALKLLMESDIMKRRFDKYNKKKLQLGILMLGVDSKKKQETFKLKGFEFTKAEKKNQVYHKEFMKFTKEMENWVAGFEGEVTKCDQTQDIVSQLRYFELQDDFGNTPLHLASFKGHTHIVKYLLDQETNIELENHEGWQCQELRQHEDIKKLYEEYIALKFLSKNKLELMALSYSMKKKKRELRKNMAKGSTIMYQSHMLVRTTPDVVLVFNTTKKSLTNKLLVNTSKTKDNKYNDAIITRVNFNIDLIQSRFHCYIAPSLNSSSFYLMIKMDEKDLEQACENNKMKIKEINDYGYKTYDLKRKTDFEPFRSRQRQEITLESLNKIVDLEQLKDLNVLEDVYIMHTESGLRRISEVWSWGLRKTWLPEPLSSFKDYFREARNINFYAITALKVYFGEKDSFYFAWFSFYICYLPILAIPGLIVYIIIKAKPDTNAIALPVWVTYTSLVSTLIVERWKRKSAEIATRWGTAEMEGVQQEKRKIRKEYSGDEIMSTDIGALTKHNPKTRMIVYNIMSIAVLVLLCAMVVASFWGIEQLKDAHPEWTSGKKTFINGANGLVIWLANYIYEWIARALVEKENHKYDDSHEQSLILKIAISKTLNSYIGVLYLTFVIQAKFTDMFLILLALLIVQILLSYAGLILGPWISYKTNEKNYFRKLTQLAKTQWENHNEENVQKPPEPELSLKRAVLDCETGAKANSEWELDQVELNNIKVEKKDILNYYGDVLVQFGYITMFAPAFPLGPVIALIANLFDIKAKLFSFVSCYKRSIAKKASGIGQWLLVWEIVSIVSIFINALSLFFNLDPNVDFFMKYFTAKKDDTYHDLVTNIARLWVFVIVVHIILILKYLAQAIIQDRPGWVQKEEEKEEYIEEMMKRATMEQDAQLKTRILSVSNIQERTKGRHQTKSSIAMNANNPSVAPSHRERLPTNTLMSEEGRSTPDFDMEKEKPREREKEKKVTLVVEPIVKEKVAPPPGGGKGKPESPLRETVTRKEENEVRTVAHKTPETAMPLVPTNLNLNHAIKSLIYNTYTVLEKELITRRIADINKLTTRIIVMCNICQKTKSVYNCKTCNEQICEKCYKEVHNKVNISKHDVVTLEEQAQENNPIVPWPEKIEPLGYLLAKNSNSSEVGYWRKFEYFNFPITKSANHFHTMKVAFNILYSMYITNNGITKDNEVENVEKALKYTKGGKQERREEGGATKGMAKYLVARDSNVIQVAKDLEGDLNLSYEQSLEQFIGLGMFNIEEKFFMNRVAFLNFKRRGARATFDEFVKKLKILEEGSFESKLFLIFDLIDQDDNGAISRSEFVSIFQYAFMQNMISGNNIDEVLAELFKSALKVNKKDVFQIVLKSKKLQSLFAGYTQTTSKQIVDGI